MQQTTISKRWLYKMLAFLVLLVAFGIYGYYDAAIKYPQRGADHAEWVQWKYLEAAKAAGGLEHQHLATPDPRERLKQLESSPTATSSLDSYQREWLSALAKIGRLEQAKLLDPATGQPQDLNALLTTLHDKWTISATGAPRPSPKPLTSFDIPTQWLFCALGLGGGLWMLSRILPVIRRKYLWDPQTKALTLPDGSVIAPADLEDVDKRKWDKFLVYLKIKPSHPKLGGKEVLVDLYQHTPLEEWILEMEGAAFPDRAAATTSDPSANTPQPSAANG